MSVTYVSGIDPGLIHTGVVHLKFDDVQRIVKIEHDVVLGTNVDDVKMQLHPGIHVFVEDYRTRSSFNTDKEMREFVGQLRKALPKATFLDNMGVKKVVRQPLMEMVGVWKFSTPTHHQDLRSAARIALLGMLKDDHLNTLLADLVLDTMFNGLPWTIQP